MWASAQFTLGAMLLNALAMGDVTAGESSFGLAITCRRLRDRTEGSIPTMGPGAVHRNTPPPRIFPYRT